MTSVRLGEYTFGYCWGSTIPVIERETLTPNDKSRIERRIEATDRHIDELVYRLYGLTAEEIGIVEGRDTQS